jgi:hypothetical protein|tara:strand:- start:63 stop:290 length:228 start_codon:yes stop_codon:yes gene_type:complete
MPISREEATMLRRAEVRNLQRDINPMEEEKIPESMYRLERKLDKYNHIMELARTCLALLTVTLQIVILMKLFSVI